LNEYEKCDGFFSIALLIVSKDGWLIIKNMKARKQFCFED